jgi:DNA-3-methyladenine glycosylase II
MSKNRIRLQSIEQSLADADPKLGILIRAVISRAGIRRISPTSRSTFQSLVRAIILQRVSAKGADTTFKTLTNLAGGKLTPLRLLSLRFDILRTAGLSKAKATYITSLARWFADHPRIASSLSKRSDDDIVEMLTQIPGIGRWTVNVFLIFKLRRLDVLPADDFGIRRGVQLVFGLKTVATPRQVFEKAVNWRPYRSIASMYLWTAVKLGITKSDLREHGT